MTATEIVTEIVTGIVTGIVTETVIGTETEIVTEIEIGITTETGAEIEEDAEVMMTMMAMEGNHLVQVLVEGQPLHLLPLSCRIHKVCFPCLESSLNSSHFLCSYLEKSCRFEYSCSCAHYSASEVISLMNHIYVVENIRVHNIIISKTSIFDWFCQFTSFRLSPLNVAKCNLG